MCYLFVDDESGENFFVEAESRFEARETAKEYFKAPRLIEAMTEEESEWYPYDVY